MYATSRVSSTKDAMGANCSCFVLTNTSTFQMIGNSFLNMFVYHWPNYALLRRASPERSPAIAFCQACVSPSLPPRTVAPLPTGHNCSLTSERMTDEETVEDIIASTHRAACFFPPQPPQDYFTECAQRVLSESARSTLRTITEDEVECDTGGTMEESKMEASLDFAVDDPDGGVEMGVIVIEETTIEVRGVDVKSAEEKQCDES